MPKQVKSKNIVEHTDDEGNLVYRIDKKNKKINYYVKTDPGKDKFEIPEILLEGFDKLPSGFYSNGFGITSGGYLIRNKLYEKFGENFTLKISSKGKSKILKNGPNHLVIFNYDDLRTFQNRIKDIKNDKNKESKIAADFYLNRYFPKHFEETEEIDESLYQQNQIAETLKKVDLIENLSKEDAEALAEFYPQFLEVADSKLQGKKKLLQISKNKTETEIVYLETIINEFEKKLKQNLVESKWQEFLREYILLFNTSYSTFIEKSSVSLEGKYPDFMLIDIYNFLDIYEIKKPSTNLLKHDESRDNYYWDKEMSKVISQAENYIDQITKNALSFKEMIKKKKGTDIRVIKPRAFVIAGHSKQLENQTKEENYRLLNSSLKNIEVILYDDLLYSLKNFLSRLKGE
jgi:hypothetical protein